MNKIYGLLMGKHYCELLLNKNLNVDEVWWVQLRPDWWVQLRPSWWIHPRLFVDKLLAAWRGQYIMLGSIINPTEVGFV